jgi:hypothetical protein|tara:strand:+ start:9142 stop:9477 length:336 start_codon:yes stop_codon:yes gene_type:complete
MVYFRKVNINESTGSATIIVSSDTTSNQVTSLAGISVGTRTQGNLSFGVLSLIDPETNLVMKADHPTIKALQSKMNLGDEMPNFQLSTSKVVNLTTGEENQNLYWVEQVPA